MVIKNKTLTMLPAITTTDFDPASSGAPKTPRKASTSVALGPGGLKARLKDKQALQSLYQESGQQLLQMKRSSGWTQASGLGKVKSKLVQLTRAETEPQQMRKYLSHLVDAPIPGKTSKADPFDPAYQQYAATINGVGVDLSVKNTAADVHVSTFAQQTHDTPLGRACLGLKADGWTVQYGADNAFSYDKKTVTLNRADSATAGLRLASALLMNLPNDAQPAAKAMQQAINHILVTPGLQVARNRVARLLPFARGDGIYHAARRKHDQSKPKPGEVAINGHDRAMVMTYRNVFRAINSGMRSNNAKARQPFEALAAEINRSLENLPVHEGVVYRGIRGVSARDIERYAQKAKEENGFITEPAFTSTSTSREAIKPYEGNVCFVIQSRTGRALGSMSKHSEVLFAAGSRFQVTGVTYKPGTETAAFPTAEIHLVEVPFKGKQAAEAGPSNTVD